MTIVPQLVSGIGSALTGCHGGENWHLWKCGKQTEEEKHQPGTRGQTQFQGRKNPLNITKSTRMFICHEKPGGREWGVRHKNGGGGSYPGGGGGGAGGSLLVWRKSHEIRRCNAWTECMLASQQGRQNEGAHHLCQGVHPWCRGCVCHRLETGNSLVPAVVSVGP